jgi:hypothetical protein
VPVRKPGVQANDVTSVPANRWVILAGYALLTACTQLLWLAYAPITTQTPRIMGVSSGAVGDLAVIFPPASTLPVIQLHRRDSYLCCHPLPEELALSGPPSSAGLR